MATFPNAFMMYALVTLNYMHLETGTLPCIVILPASLSARGQGHTPQYDLSLVPTQCRHPPATLPLHQASLDADTNTHLALWSMLEFCA